MLENNGKWLDWSEINSWYTWPGTLQLATCILRTNHGPVSLFILVPGNREYLVFEHLDWILWSDIDTEAMTKWQSRQVTYAEDQFFQTSIWVKYFACSIWWLVLDAGSGIPSWFLDSKDHKCWIRSEYLSVIWIFVSIFQIYLENIPLQICQKIGYKRARLVTLFSDLIFGFVFLKTLIDFARMEVSKLYRVW